MRRDRDLFTVSPAQRDAMLYEHLIDARVYQAAPAHADAPHLHAPPVLPINVNDSCMTLAHQLSFDRGMMNVFDESGGGAGGRVQCASVKSHTF